uniref:Slc17a-5 n=1 Tax=Schmidtea mediterranea TaxID=79327 RepID=A0A0H3YK80_SCHMD|nr:slc17a-5 [Schmidtea mediterranea]
MITMKEELTEKYPLCNSKRLIVALIGFIGTLNLYSIRMNLSVGILCMTNHTAVDLMDNHSFVPKNFSNVTKTSCALLGEEKAKDGDLVWSKQTRSIILGVFFWGYLVTQIPAGMLVQRFSPKWILFGFMMLSSLSVMFTPLAARTSVGFMIALRVICGLCSGVWFPSIYQLWSRWAPPQDRSLLVGLTNSGLHVGNALTLPIAGLLCEYGFAGGWPSIFYTSGLFGILWCILWAFLIYDTPSDHPTISDGEKNYIEKSLCGEINDSNKNVNICDLPWRAIATSKPFWAIAVINIMFDWNGYTFITSTPTYMKEVLKFNMSQNGFVSAAPYIGMGIGQICFAILCDILQKRKILSVTRIRKLMNCLGMLTPGLIVVILAYLKCESRYLAVVLLTIGLSATSALFVGAFVNHVDIAPQYAGLLFGLTNTLGAFTGFFSSYFVGAVTKNNDVNSWRIVFFVCSIIYVAGAIFYLIFGSGKLQSWAIQNTNDSNNFSLLNKDKEKEAEC